MTPYGERSLEILRQVSAGDTSLIDIAGAIGITKVTAGGILLRLTRRKEVSRKKHAQGRVNLGASSRKNVFYLYSITDLGIRRLNRALVRKSAQRKNQPIE